MQVTYQTDSFLDKNRDYVIVEHCNLLSSSKCPFVSGLFASLPDESSRSSYKFSSVSSRFKVPQGFNYYGYLGVRIASSNPNFEFKSTESDQNSGPRLNALGPFNIRYLEGGIETKNMYIFSSFKATTPITYGHTQVYWASLRTMCEAQFSQPSSNLWKPECIASTPVWCKWHLILYSFGSPYLLIGCFCRFIKFHKRHFSFYLFSAGCFRGS